MRPQWLSPARSTWPVPRARCMVEGDEHLTGFGASDQQDRIVQAKPGSASMPVALESNMGPQNT
jgi:hypothetical protein